MTYWPILNNIQITVKLARFVPGGPLPFLTVGTFDTLTAANEAGREALKAVTDEPETAGYLLLDEAGREVGNWTYWDELVGQNDAELTQFERAAICHIAEDHLNEMPKLFAEADGATVVKRENTGSGFYTHLQFPNDSPRWKGHSPIGERLYKINQYEAPFGVILFFEGGLPSLIDCHFFGEATTLGTDFTNAQFSPWEK
jgi:hypothetical protein